METPTTPRPLGYMNLDPIKAAHKRAYINQTTAVTIIDQDSFGRFTAAMVTSQNFTWRLQADNLKLRADKFPEAKGILFSKDLMLNGILVVGPSESVRY